MRLARVTPFPPPFVWMVFLPSGPVGGPFSWPRPRFPRYPCLFPSSSPAFFLSARATHGPSPALFAPTRSPAACSPIATRPPVVHCGSVFFCFSWSAPPHPFPQRFLPSGFLPLPRMLVFFNVLPACTHVSTALVIGSRLPSVFVSGPLALVGSASWRSLAKPGGRPSLASLSSLPSLLSPPLPSRHLSLACPLTAALLLCVLSAAYPLARAVSRTLSRASVPPPCPPSCRPT